MFFKGRVNSFQSKGENKSMILTYKKDKLNVSIVYHNPSIE